MKSSHPSTGSPQEAAKLKRARMLTGEVMARTAVENRLYWMYDCTKTKDEQDHTGNPYKPFPAKPAFPPMLEALDNESVFFIKKSRTMMGSWLVSAWAAHRMFNRPATGILVQSQDHDRSVHIVDNVKILWEQSIPELQARWRPSRGRGPRDQPFFMFEMQNGSWIKAIPGDPDKIRSDHPTDVIFDEAAHLAQAEASFNLARATRCHHIVLLSSTAPGWFASISEDTVPVDWPDYSRKEDAA